MTQSCLYINIAKMSANNKHIVRDKYVEMLVSKINLPKDDAMDLEIGIFNYTLDYCNENNIQLSWTNAMFTDTYINNARSIYTNLKKDSYIGNKNLIERLNKREFLPHDIAFMSFQEIFPEKWEAIINKQKLKLKDAYEVKNVAMTDAIKCGKCKNNKISYYELQIRSGDENMTQFFTCLVCGNKWKS